MQDSLPMEPVPYALPKYLSPSSIGTFNQCPMRYKYAKLDKIPEPSTEPQILGSFVHEILEDLFKLDADERTEQNARKIAKGLWNDKWSKEYHDLPKKDSTENEFRWKAWWCVENYFIMEDPTSFEAEGIEAKMDGDINGGTIFGIIDRWSLSDDNKLIISDYKTGKKPRPQYEWEKKMQISIYCILLEKETGLNIDRGELLYLKSGSFARYDISEEMKEAVTKEVTDTWDQLKVSCESGEFETRTGPLCNWGNYQKICPAWRK